MAGQGIFAFLELSESYMQRCLQLAESGAGHVAPNPMVGAVLVHDHRIIGEGWHQHFGQAHAEVNCINSVVEADRPLIRHSSLYVSLEPCAHFGKTPPCVDLIIKEKIPHVIVGCRDPFPKVDGRGIEKLRSAGVTVDMMMEKECRELNKRFFCFHNNYRPYIILKWAETNDGKISGDGSSRLLISNPLSNRLVHKWRSEEAAILVGTNTALLDDPALTTREWPGASPTRLIVDMHLRLPASLQIFNGQSRTIIFNVIKHKEQDNTLYYQVTEDTNLVHQVLNALYQMGIQSVIVEGGAKLLQSFIDEHAWDEARIIRSNTVNSRNGLPAPVLGHANNFKQIKLDTDTVNWYKPTHEH